MTCAWIAARRLRWTAVAAVSLVTVIAGVGGGAPLVGPALVLEEDLRPAGAIVVLNGDTPDRVDEAIALYREGWAPEIWLTQWPDSDEFATRIAAGEVVDGGTRTNMETLRKAGMPMSTVRVLPEPVRNTAEELAAVARAARARGLAAMIVVTSPPHTRRVRFIWNRAIGTPPIVVRHPGDSRWQLGRWWRDGEGRRAVMHEIAGLVVAGFLPPRATVTRSAE